MGGRAGRRRRSHPRTNEVAAVAGNVEHDPIRVDEALKVRGDDFPELVFAGGIAVVEPLAVNPYDGLQRSPAALARLVCWRAKGPLLSVTEQEYGRLATAVLVSTS